MKYNLNNLHWQEFEVLSFQCLQKVISTGIQYLERGKDKGRDIVYEGNSSNFPTWSGKWICQVKHFSIIETSQSKQINSLINDLKDELEKIHVKERLEFDNYILVTNLNVTANLNDKANILFSDFFLNQKLPDKNFHIFGYRHFESCIDSNECIKWNFQNILSHPDFQLLIKSISESIIDNRNIGWFNSILKYRKYFIYTRFYDQAFQKLQENHAILLSGPPKSGKTFNAEILTFNYVGDYSYKPLKIDDPDEIERYYRPECKQIFLCDDAFGSHRLSFIHADDWNKKIQGILALSDNSHKFIFTSREHVFNAFKSFATNFRSNQLEKLIVKNEDLTLAEKSAILRKYIEQSDIPNKIKKSLLKDEGHFIKHPCFSPESIRSFFANIKTGQINEYTIYHHLIAHLNTPDAYLRDLFFQLEVRKRTLLLAVLCSLNPNDKEIGKTYASLCNDLNTEKMDSYKIMLEELDGGILKKIQNSDSYEVSYYHPTMKEGLIQIIKNDENGTIHNSVIMNINIELFDSCYFKSPKAKGKNLISISQTELESFSVGLKRLLSNENIQFFHIIRLLKWFANDNSDSLIKILDKPFYSLIKHVIIKFIANLKAESFYLRFQNTSISKWSELVWCIKSIGTIYSIKLEDLFFDYWYKILEEQKNEQDYWKFVFRFSNFVPNQVVYDKVGRDWLNNFYMELRKNLYELGYEIFGTEFPQFANHENLTVAERAKNQKLKYKPNRTWYTRFLICKDKVACLKDLKGNEIGHEIFIRVEKEYDELLRYSDYASNRQDYNEEHNWW